MQITSEQLSFVASLFTPLVSDTMDSLGLTGFVVDRSIQAIPFSAGVKACGIAYPCRVVPTSEYVEIETLLEMIDSIPADSIVLVAADSDTDAALWGGLMSTRAKARGARGAIVNGGIRDFEQIAQLDFPVFGEYRCIKDIRRRGYMHSYNVAVTLGGVEVQPGDVVFADANGVIAIPQQHFERVLVALHERLEGELKTAEGLANGASAQSLFQDFKTF